MTLLPGMNASGTGRHGWSPTNRANLYGGDGGVCVNVLAHACAQHACGLDVFAIYDNNM